MSAATKSLTAEPDAACTFAADTASTFVDHCWDAAHAAPITDHRSSRRQITPIGFITKLPTQVGRNGERNYLYENSLRLGYSGAREDGVRRDHSQLAPFAEFIPTGRTAQDAAMYKVMRRISRLNRQQVHEAAKAAIMDAWLRGTGYMKVIWTNEEPQ